MTITLESVGKRFHRDWVIRNLSQTFSFPGRYGIAGPNGSGKSTLLRVISGQLTPSEGTVVYQNSEGQVEIDKVYRHISWAAPYLELIEEFTLAEHLRFHSRFQNMATDAERVAASVGLSYHSEKRIGDFSSGMKQRLKLALAMFSMTPVLLLDEPTSNLDEEGIAWFQSALSQMADDRLVIIASNEERDLIDCDVRIDLGVKSES